MSGGVRAFRAADAQAVRAIQEASLATDAIPGFVPSDIDRAMIRIVADPDGTVVATEGDAVVGYCTPHHDDLTVLPAARRRGHGRRLVGAALAVVRARGRDELQLYVPPHLPASIAFAEAVGLRYRSSLWQFTLPAGRAVPEPDFPGDVVIRTWDAERDTDLEAWTAFMLAAFEGHPTPMSWTPAVIRAVHEDPGFDPGSILIVAEAADPTRLVAFARIEMHDDPTAGRTGDVGLIGVLPAWRRRGLGRELLRWGVTTLRAGGAGPIELSVEAANERATALYRSHGFEPSIEWPHWVMPAAD
jgi:mycothiol synthase